ncbi:Uncharacterised protein [BD1-7 clade bacterium]|uniref:Sulfotransferase n=1 Tax=BD1-7 clade bacterium TaxID=2029982 RepID=A0A5S9R1J5_9GAMM|nr:Uncharacterised protein [BD1-7 clade bacterium]
MAVSGSMTNTSVLSQYVHRPLAIGVINAVGRIRSRLGMSPKIWSIDKMERQALKRCGLTQIPSTAHREGLAVMIDDVQKTALNAVGVILFNGFCVNSLVTKFTLEQQKNNTSITETIIDNPVIIAGSARTGTTLLHQLLNLDDRHRSMLGWEALNPVDYKAASSAQKRYQRSKMMIGATDYLAPLAAQIHPCGPDLPQECNIVHAVDFECHQNSVLFEMPQYQRWIAQQSWQRRLDTHKLCLQTLQLDQSDKRWVMKSPFYPSALDNLRDTYPNADIVFTHRDPKGLLNSFCSLALSYRQIVTDDIDLHRLGKQMLELFATDLDQSVDLLMDPRHENSIYHLHYDEFVSDPALHLRKLYDHFGWEFTPQVAASLKDHMANDAEKTRAKHKPSLDMFGLTAEQIDTAFSRYNAYVKSIRQARDTNEASATSEPVVLQRVAKGLDGRSDKIAEGSKEENAACDVSGLVVA